MPLEAVRNRCVFLGLLPGLLVPLIFQGGWVGPGGFRGVSLADRPPRILACNLPFDAFSFLSGAIWLSKFIDGESVQKRQTQF